MELRRYRPSDQDVVWDLHVLGLQQTGAYLGSGPWDDDLRAIEVVYLAAGGDFLVGEERGRVVAMGALKRRDAERAEVKRMRVHPDYQGQGRGTALLHALEERARELGYRALRLDTSTAQPAALRLYRHHGYLETHRKTLRGLELVFLEKCLG